MTPIPSGVSERKSLLPTIPNLKNQPTTMNAKLSNVTGEVISNTSTSPANPQAAAAVHNPAHLHTLDESNIAEYPPGLQSELLLALQENDKKSALKVGVVLFGSLFKGQTMIPAITSLISQCSLVALTLLHPKTYDDCKDSGEKDALEHEEARKWLEENGSVNPILSAFLSHYYNQKPPEYKFYCNPDGYQKMLESPELDAVYVLCPSEVQSSIVLQALQARKHVLVHDPQSTTLPDFKEQVTAARASNRFIQFSTMFGHQHRVQTFFDSVAHKLGNENMERMHLLLHVHPDDWDTIGVADDVADVEAQPRVPQLDISSYNDNCIRRLARFGVLNALLLLEQKAQSQPTHVQITKCTVNSLGIPVEASGEVCFSENRKLTFDVGYNSAHNTNSKIGPTRQVLEVHAPDRYATMNDVCYNHADGLATYRIYDKALHLVNNSNTDIKVTGGEALDVVSGPTMHGMSWRRFAQICRAVDGGRDKEGSSCLFEEESKRLREQAKRYTLTALQLKIILSCLEESQRQGNVGISLPLAVEQEMSNL